VSAPSLTAECAPEDIDLLVCDACGRTDRYRDLPRRPYHYTDEGVRCHGDVVSVAYRRVPRTDERSTDAH
jgi:hypothetical protein